MAELQTDLRAYAFKFLKKEQGLVFGAAPLEETDMRGAVCRRRKLHEWKMADGQEFLLCEVVYSYEAAKCLLATPKPILQGPDLFHVLHKSSNTLIWRVSKPVYLQRNVEIRNPLHPETYSVETIREDANITLLTRLQKLISGVMIELQYLYPFEIVLIPPDD